MILIFLFLMAVISVAGWVILNPPVRYEDDTDDGVKDILWDIIGRKHGWRCIAANELHNGDLLMTFHRLSVSTHPNQVVGVTANYGTNEVECRSDLNYNYDSDHSIKQRKFVDKTLTKGLYDFKDSLTEKEKEDLI